MHSVMSIGYSRMSKHDQKNSLSGLPESVEKQGNTSCDNKEE